MPWRNKRVITDECNEHLGPLLTRYFLFKTSWLTLMVHCFHRSDNDRHCHDHPWSFITFLLTPYREHTPTRTFYRRRFSILYRPAEYQHWVEVMHPKTWTIVLHFRRRRIWGFHTSKGFVPFDTYDCKG